MGVSGGMKRLGEEGEGLVEDEAEAEREEEELEAAVGECIAMRMRRALGEAEVMGDGGTMTPASDEAEGEASDEADEPDVETCSVSCFFGVTIATGNAPVDAADDDEALRAFFFPTGVTATAFTLPAPTTAPADEDALNVVTILLLPLGVFSVAVRRALSFDCDTTDLLGVVRSCCRSRMSDVVEEVWSLVRCGECGWGLSAGTGCLVASIRGQAGGGSVTVSDQ